MKILVLEDDLGIRRALEVFFDWEGHRVRSFGSGEDALQFLNSAEVDVIVMDWNTPGRSGNAFLEAVDEICLPLFRPRVVILSGDPAASAAVELNGAHVFLLKPVLPERLIQNLEAHPWRKVS